jgi:hypothetical protein
MAFEDLVANFPVVYICQLFSAEQWPTQARAACTHTPRAASRCPAHRSARQLSTEGEWRGPTAGGRTALESNPQYVLEVGLRARPHQPSCGFSESSTRVQAPVGTRVVLALSQPNPRYS